MSEPVYFLGLEIENVRCFGPKTTLDLSDGKGNWKKWTVILGDNGTGKTTLLQLLASSEDIKKGDHYMPSAVDRLRRFSSPDALKESRKGIVAIFTTLPDINGTLRLTFEGNVLHEAIRRKYESNKSDSIQCFGYGANRSMSGTSLTKNESDNSETLFDDNAKLVNAEEWLLQLDYAASKEPETIYTIHQQLERVKQILVDLLPDVEYIRIGQLTINRLNYSVEFKTPYGWVSIHQLSLGYKTMVSWMVDLAARMFQRYPDSKNPLAEPAIVLVDEIDLHMHPKWQRKIFDYLSEKFPQTQFIVTAHSPLVVQSAPKDANIVLLRKEGDHVVIDNDIKSVQNWRIDQILTSDLFGIDSARGPETAEWLKERKELLQKQSLTKQEKERLNELNQRSFNLPTEEKKEDIEAMELIRKAAEHLKNH